MKIELSYVAINTDVEPPVLTTTNGFSVVATDSSLQQAHAECYEMMRAIEKFKKPKEKISQ